MLFVFQVSCVLLILLHIGNVSFDISWKRLFLSRCGFGISRRCPSEGFARCIFPFGCSRGWREGYSPRRWGVGCPSSSPSCGEDQWGAPSEPPPTLSSSSPFETFCSCSFGETSRDHCRVRSLPSALACSTQLLRFCRRPPL